MSCLRPDAVVAAATDREYGAGEDGPPARYAVQLDDVTTSVEEGGVVDRLGVHGGQGIYALEFLRLFRGKLRVVDQVGIARGHGPVQEDENGLEKVDGVREHVGSFHLLYVHKITRIAVQPHLFCLGEGGAVADKNAGFVNVVQGNAAG